MPSCMLMLVLESCFRCLDRACSTAHPGLLPFCWCFELSFEKCMCVAHVWQYAFVQQPPNKRREGRGVGSVCAKPQRALPVSTGDASERAGLLFAQVGVGLPLLYGLGVVHVCALEGAGAASAAAAALLAGDAPVQRLVLLTTQLLPDTHSAALRALQVRSAL